jgi:CheY-like chemotaxis protein
MADPTQIDQIVMNLATNARDAMPEGGRLTIETAAAAPGELLPSDGDGAAPEGGLCLSVSDTGAGMDEETQQRVYDPFFTTKSTGRGTGLGLFIVHSAVSNHGGQVRLFSEPGKGTRISVCLPVTRGPVAVAGPPTVDPRGIGTILVIDDEAVVREVCRDLLASLGYTVLTAGDGEEGVRRYRAAPDRIDLVLLDLVLPGMSGPEVFEQLQRIRADVRVVLCSGFSPSGYAGIDSLIAAGALGFVQKPFTLQAIGTAIKAALTGG